MLPALHRRTPATLLRDELKELSSHMPGVLDGLSDSVHDARVAIRRVREVLPLIGERQHIGTDLQQRLKRIGRALGRVRDKDVLIAVLSSLETTLAHAAPAVVVLRQRHERERQALARELIRTLEKLEAEKLLAALAGHRTVTYPAVIRAFADRPSWRRVLRRTIHARAASAATAVAQATGVYFPKRTHQVRIAAKKFRYALEIADGTGEHVAPHALETLKLIQDVLGELHDRQVLIEELSASAQDGAEHVGTGQVELVIQTVEAENRKLHGKYLDLRARLLEICREETQLSGSAAIMPLAAAGALVMSSLLLARGRASRVS